MNKERRNELNGLRNDLSCLKEELDTLRGQVEEDYLAEDETKENLSRIVGGIEDAKSSLETCRDDEQDYYDNMPENFRQGDRGQAAEAAVSELEEAISSIDSAITDLSGDVAEADFDNALSNLDDALSSIDNATA